MQGCKSLRTSSWDAEEGSDHTLEALVGTLKVSVMDKQNM
jgi:hypothetical protein